MNSNNHANQYSVRLKGGAERVDADYYEVRDGLVRFIWDVRNPDEPGQIIPGASFPIVAFNLDQVVKVTTIVPGGPTDA